MNLLVELVFMNLEVWLKFHIGLIAQIILINLGIGLKFGIYLQN